MSGRRNSLRMDRLRDEVEGLLHLAWDVLVWLFVRALVVAALIAVVWLAMSVAEWLGFTRPSCQDEWCSENWESPW